MVCQSCPRSLSCDGESCLYADSMNEQGGLFTETVNKSYKGTVPIRPYDYISEPYLAAQSTTTVERVYQTPIVRLTTGQRDLSPLPSPQPIPPFAGFLILAGGYLIARSLLKKR